MQIIKVEPVPQYFVITWMLGSLCNYDCMYCASDLHDSTSKPHDLKTLQLAWNDIQQKSDHLGLPYKISFTGGEVTANKSFLPFAEWLRANLPSTSMIIVTTNGSASINYYSRLSDLVDAISFSTHSEFMDEAEFFSKVRHVNTLMKPPAKSVHVNIMDEPWNQHRISLYKDFCDRHGIRYSVNKLNMTLRIRDQHAPLPETTLERLG